jgi:hypothetical protein
VGPGPGAPDGAQLKSVDAGLKVASPVAGMVAGEDEFVLVVSMTRSSRSTAMPSSEGFGYTGPGAEHATAATAGTTRAAPTGRPDTSTATTRLAPSLRP